MSKRTKKLDISDNSPLIVRFNNVSFSYNNPFGGGKIAAKPALSNVNLDLEKGGFYLLTGPSGAGKSTLLKLMYLALRPTTGKMEMFGEDLNRCERDDLPLFRRKIGVVFQDFRLLSHLSVFDNLAMPFRVRGTPPSDYIGDVEEFLNWVGLGKRMDALPETLSGGEQQRVAIARAVVGKPSLLIADEPTGNVDPQMGAKLIRLFIELNRLGTTVVIATHDQEIVKRLQVPIIRIENGFVTQSDRSPSSEDQNNEN